jgi:hypothetical protein
MAAGVAKVLEWYALVVVYQRQHRALKAADRATYKARALDYPEGFRTPRRRAIVDVARIVDRQPVTIDLELRGHQRRLPPAATVPDLRLDPATGGLWKPPTTYTVRVGDIFRASK